MKALVKSSCYVCGDRAHVEGKLWNGEIVGYCRSCHDICYPAIVNGRGGDKMVIRERPVTGDGNYLKVEFIEKNSITELTITGDITEVEFTNDGVKVKKLQAEVSYEGQRPDDPNIWTMNKKSVAALFDLWGADDSNWKNKKIPLSLGGEGKMRHFKVDSLRLKKQ